MRRLLLLLLFFTLVGHLFSPSASADERIHSAFEVEYLISPSGHATVTQHVTLTNRQSQVFATSYLLTLQGPPPQHLVASDSAGPLQIQLQSPSLEITNVLVQFTHPTSGRGRQYQFTLSYSAPPATKNGQIWEITLPKLAAPDQVDQYHLSLRVPQSFGPLAYISPPPESTTSDSQLQTYSFSLAHVAAQPVTAAFGQFQTFDFHLTYHLQNSSFFATTKTLALPPDTAYQKVFFNSITPRPSNVRPDADGNWLADYRLPRRSTLEIIAQGQVHLLSSPISLLSAPLIPPSADYLKSAPFWDTNPEIQDLAHRLATPRAIYDFVVDTLTYDYDRLATTSSRLGAAAALSAPTSSLCTEFTDLFIALARAAGIPAREVNGYAHTSDLRLQPLSLVTDVLHAWPEYWDDSSGLWRAVDPTWGHTTGNDFFTTLDLSHFAFVIHGLNSQTPLSPGLYKTSPNTKDVQVTLGQYRDYLTRPIESSWHPAFQFLPFLTNPSRLTLTNPNGTALSHLTLDITAHGLPLSTPATSVLIDHLPPFASVELPLTFHSQVLPAFVPKFLTLSVADHQVTYNISEKNFLLWYALIVLTLILTILSLALLAHRAWNLYFQKRLRPNSLHRQSQKSPRSG